MNCLLQCEHITKKVGNFVLRDIHFELESGYILGVIGRNGAGKSTLVRLLLGSLKLYNYHEDYKFQTAEGKAMAANKGDICLDGYSLKREGNLYKERIAFILNDSPFMMALNAKDNGRLYGSYYQSFDYGRYIDLCESYEVPLRLPLKDLSKGEQIKQQLAFSQAYDAKLYVFDEPAGNLDVRFRDTFYDVMRGIVEDGTKSIIYVTHLVEELENLADYILWIEEGKQRGYGSMECILDAYLLYDGPKELLEGKSGYQVIAMQEKLSHFEALLYQEEGRYPEEITTHGRRATLKEIMYYESPKE